MAGRSRPGWLPALRGSACKITVARAALGNPRLLILDEAEAHLDRAATDMVDRVLSNRAGTTLVVTHRRELVERADVVWCLEDGRVAEVGPPDVLMTGDGLTARLLGTSGKGAVTRRLGPRPTAVRALAT